MALIKSTLLAQISGSIAGATFAHNRGGAYARSRALVSNPQTARQSEVRTSMASLATMWRDSLTQAQRDDWIAYGGTVSVVNRVGDTISLSGIAAFTRVNMFRVASLDLAPTLTVPASSALPASTVVPAFTSINLETDGVAGGAILTVNLNATASTNFGLVIYYSAPLSPGVRYFRGPYAGRQVVPTPTGASPSTNLLAVTIPVGQYRAFRISLYDVNSKLPIWTVNTDPFAAVAI